MGAMKLTNLNDSQSAAIAHLEKYKVGALFMEAGTGKTRAAMSLINSSGCRRCLWIAPLRTIKNTQAEIAKWGGLIPETLYVGVESIGLSERIFLDTQALMEAGERPFVVVDESLKIKNMGALRTSRVLKLGELAQYKLVLNGTPLSKNLLDLYPQMLFLSPKILNMSETQFRDTFCKYTETTSRGPYGVRKSIYVTGYENVDYLYSLIEPYIYECNLQIEAKRTYKSIHYSLGAESSEKYSETKAYFLNQDTLDEWSNNIFMAMTQRLQHDYCCDASKINALKRLFAKKEDEAKCLIFCKYIDSQELCRREFPKAVILSYQKAALGLNLQSYNCTVFFDQIWDYALRIQAEHRTYRTGQEEDCRYYTLRGNCGLEKMIERNVSKKESMLDYFRSKTKEEIFKEL